MFSDLVDERNEIIEKEQFLHESLKELEIINKRLAKLIKRKEELTDGVIAALDHNHEGQKTYEYDVWKVEIKTPFVYSLDKKLYESGQYKLPVEFNPIKESVSYSIDKRLCDEYLLKAPKKVRDALAELIEKKPGKPSVTIKERV